MQTVTRDNFIRAETDTYFANFAKDGAFGKLIHNRGFPDIDHQTVVRMNRDTLYSSGIFDLDAGPVTITLPDVGKRFMSLLLISEDHYNPATYYGKGSYTISREQVGTRYVALLVRTFVDPGNPEDLATVHALQDEIAITQTGTGSFEVPQWDQTSLTKIRDDLKQARSFDARKAFGTRETVDPEAHLIGTACGWGGNPAEDAVYIAGRPAKDDGTTVHRLDVKDVPVEGFWSVTVYNKDGYFEANPQNAYSLNNVTAKQDADGYFRIQFGGCDGQVSNCLPIMPEWNYTVRLYRPRPEVLDGSWAFPAILPTG